MGSGELTNGKHHDQRTLTHRAIEPMTLGIMLQPASHAATDCSPAWRYTDRPLSRVFRDIFNSGPLNSSLERSSEVICGGHVISTSGRGTASPATGARKWS